MEGKDKFSTYVASFGYPLSYSSVFLRLRLLMCDMNFFSIMADEYGISRQLNENSFVMTTSLAASEIEDLVRLRCLDLPDTDSDLNIIAVDNYFRQFYKQPGGIRRIRKMALFSRILISCVIGMNIPFIIIWSTSHEKTHICSLSASLVGITWPMSPPVALLFSLSQGLQLNGLIGYLEAKRLPSELDLWNDERSSRLAAPLIKVEFTFVGASPGREQRREQYDCL